MSRNELVVHFWWGEGEDQEGVQLRDISVVPRVGDRVTISGTRDQQGNYVHERPQTYHQGVVDHIDYTFEQRGRSSADYYVVTFAEVYLRAGATQESAGEALRGD